MWPVIPSCKTSPPEMCIEYYSPLELIPDPAFTVWMCSNKPLQIDPKVLTYCGVFVNFEVEKVHGFIKSHPCPICTSKEERKECPKFRAVLHEG